MKELKMSIDLKPIQDDQIKDQHIALSDLWMIKDRDEKILGPFETNQLKDYALTYDYLFDDLEAYNLETEKWQKLFAITIFQRRKPKLVAAQNLNPSDKNLYIQSKGHYLGPLNAQDIKVLLDKGEILSSDLLSVDDKKTWIKIYEHHMFDRRQVRTHEDLPVKPQDNLLKEVNIEQSALESDIDQDVIVGLAFLSHGKDKGHHIKSNKKVVQESSDTKNHTHHEVKTNDEKSDRASKFNKTYIFAIAGCLILSLVAINFWSNHKSRPVMVDRSVKAPTKSIDNSTRSITKRSPSSVVQKPKRLKALKRKPLIRPRRPSKVAPRVKKVVREDYQENLDEGYNENYEIESPELEEEMSREFAGGYDDLSGDEKFEEEIPEEYEDEGFPIEERIEHEADDY